MRISRAVLIFWVPLIAWFLVIYNFSATPGKDLPHLNIPHADKIFHIVQYFVLGALLIRTFDHSRLNVSLAKMAFLAIIISLCYGAIDEWHQTFTPGRSCDIFDYLADCAGSLVGISIYIFDSKHRRTR